MHELGGIPVVESVLAPVGALILIRNGRRVIVMHPLDLIAITSGSVFERLDRAMSWIVDDGMRRLAAVERKLCTPEDRDFHVEDEDHEWFCYCGREWICPFWGDQLGHEREPWATWSEGWGDAWAEGPVR